MRGSCEQLITYLLSALPPAAAVAGHVVLILLFHLPSPGRPPLPGLGG